jgi:hypothetical protein
MKKFNRREFMDATWKSGLAIFCTSGLPLSFAHAFKSNQGPHFFFNIIIPNGLDFSYLVDSRPMSLTQAGVRANYLNEEATELLFANGKKTLVTRLYEPLLAFKDDFSVIQGIHMSSSFDGHEQNLNLLLTGNPFGGDVFLPHLNTQSLSLDGITNTRIPAAISNDAKIVPLSGASMQEIKLSLANSGQLSSSSTLYQALERNYSSSDFQTSGRMGLGTKQLKQALNEQDVLYTKFSSLPPVAPGTSALQSYLQSSFHLLKEDITRTINLVLRPEANLIVDTHSVDDAKKTEDLVKSIVSQIIEVMKTLKDTPFNSHQSFMDVSTFMVSTEFGRSNRQPGAVVTNTGTDHNPFNNAVLLGGKGIRKNQVVGESDMALATEALSQAHLSFDTNRMKIFGRPFDFNSQTTSQQLPQLYNGADYITSASLINTVYKAFGVPTSFYRKNGRDSVPASVVSCVLDGV